MPLRFTFIQSANTEYNLSIYPSGGKLRASFMALPNGSLWQFCYLTSQWQWENGGAAAAHITLRRWEITLNCSPAWKMGSQSLPYCLPRDEEWLQWIHTCTLASLGLMCCEEEKRGWWLFCLLSGWGFIWFEALVLHGRAGLRRQSCHTANGGPRCWQEPSGKKKKK